MAGEQTAVAIDMTPGNMKQALHMNALWQTFIVII